MIKSKKIFVSSVAVLVFVISGSLLAFSRLDVKQVLVPTENLSFIFPTEWTTYRNGDIEFKYPKDWVLVAEVPSNFQKFLKSGDGCDGVVFYDKNNPQVMFILENYSQFEGPSYFPSCWVWRSARTAIVAPSLVSARKIFLTTTGGNNQHAGTQIFGVKNELTGEDSEKEYFIEQYEMRSDSVDGNIYQLSIVYPLEISSEVQSMFDSIIESAQYLRKHQPSLAYPVEWKTFVSQKLEFSFEYPAEWGTVKEKIVDYTKEQNRSNYYVADAGKGYQLSFFKKSNIPYHYRVYGVGQSADFVAGREFIHTDYNGDPKKTAEIISEVGVNLTSRCSESGYPVGPPTTHVIKFNLPGEDIGGVMLVFSVLSISDSKKYNQLVDDFMKKEIDCRDMWGDNVAGEKAKQVYEKLLTKEKEISEMLRTGENFDKESQINLTIYNRILKSAKIPQ